MIQDLEKQLRETELRKTGYYEKRTRHMDASGGTVFVNRLIEEDSPYLLQHAHNPVDWHAWGEEAFAAAVREDKPIFLSIGYSTCHWCHVMEAESFDNIEIARLLNRLFINIKLDREQSPDIDDYYMTGVQILSGHGGWPMSNFLLPDGRPFFAATYFPPAQFADLLQRIAQAWKQQRHELEKSAEGTVLNIERVLQGRKEVRAIELEKLLLAADRMLEREDSHYGGLAGAPKFPQEPLLHYFLDATIRGREERKMQFINRALSGMAEGGIYDQVGGGFHRYSTDSQWLVPHFEKMLYNQSQLVPLYLGAWRLTGRHFFLRVLVQTLDYVLREMQQPEGGFYSATDADSEEQEGLFFVWTLAELAETLDAEELQLAIDLYAPSEAGNFEGSNILTLERPMEEVCKDDPSGRLDARLDVMLGKLLAARQQRIAPLRDDKLIVAWSAAMATTLAWAGWELEQPRYIEAAKRAVDFMISHNYAGRKNLFRIYLGGEVSVTAQLEDYANLCEAVLTLFDITGEAGYLERALALLEDLLALFWNEESKGFYLGPEHRQGPVLARSSSAADGATLSSYGVAVDCIVSLLERLELVQEQPKNLRIELEARLQQAISAASGELVEFPAGHVTLLRAIRHHLEGSAMPIRYGAAGRLKISVRGKPQINLDVDKVQRVLQIQLSTAPGYHVTTELADNNQLVPWRVDLAANEQHWEIAATDLSREEPAGIDEDSGPFNERLLITVTLTSTDQPADLLAASMGVDLLVQVCSDSLCLQPERFSFRF